MVAQPADVTATPTAPAPTRFCAAPARNARLARPLRVVAGVRELDPHLVAELGRRMQTRDELGAALAGAMKRPADDPQRVTMRQFHTALADGVDAVPDAGPELRRFFAVVDEVPAWVDLDLVERGARAFRRLGRTRIDVLLALSLIGGYRFGGPADLLVATGGLTGDTAMRRLGETETWGRGVTAPGGMRRDGEGFRLTVHVRVMHALVNRAFETNGRWDAGRWGLPINQTDLATTLGLFNSTALLGSRALGRLVTREESRAVMHLWKYVGWLMGVDEDWLFDTEREQNVFNYHVLRVQDDVTPAGAALSRALVDGHGALPDRCARPKLLGLLRFFLGAEGLRDLGLPRASALPVLPGAVINLVASGVVARTRAGRRFLERAGDRATEQELARWFGERRAEVGRLPG
ncbi:oxygenase MpaB family protein [Actinomycetospora sp. CA-101289]|uniref:oxygenase MpaB family protein n=1 Tax=Actinomycetospora sp. CA-101289 TaxID=3239893 RepID=UPI003D968577